MDFEDAQEMFLALAIIAAIFVDEVFDLKIIRRW